MGHRTIRDEQGVEWQVWDTTPAKQVSQTLEGGWLTFESPTEKRRLAPVPLYWLNAEDSELLALLDGAKRVDRALKAVRASGGHPTTAGPDSASKSEQV